MTSCCHIYQHSQLISTCFDTSWKGDFFGFWPSQKFCIGLEDSWYVRRICFGYVLKVTSRSQLELTHLLSGLSVSHLFKDKLPHMIDLKQSVNYVFRGLKLFLPSDLIYWTWFNHMPIIISLQFPMVMHAYFINFQGSIIFFIHQATCQ